jgi:integrase/recombinase XerD
VSVGFSIKKSDWNVRIRQVRSSNLSAGTINAAIMQKIIDADGAILKSAVQQKSITPKALQKKLSGQSGNGNSFITFTQDYIDGFKSRAFSTYETKNSMLNQFKKFLKQSDLTFEEFDLNTCKKYKKWMEDNGHSQHGINAHFRNLRAAYNKAVQEEMAEPGSSPFLRFKLPAPTRKKPKEKLTEVEVNKIEALELELNSRQWHVRNYFLFAVYCAGMRISDIITLKWSYITADNRLEYRMYKTDIDISIKLHAKAVAILDLYRGQREDYVFPILNPKKDYSTSEVITKEIKNKTKQFNDRLEEIANLAKIKKKVRTHIARHTFADMARQKSGNVYAVSKALGHSSVTITEGYLKSFDKDAVDELMDLF